MEGEEVGTEDTRGGEEVDSDLSDECYKRTSLFEEVDSDSSEEDADFYFNCYANLGMHEYMLNDMARTSMPDLILKAEHC